MIVPLIGAVILMSFGWRWVFLLLAIPGIFFAISWFIFVAETPRGSRFVSKREADYIEANDSSFVATKGEKTSVIGVRKNFVLLDRLLRAREAPLLQTRRQILTSYDFIAITLGYFFIQGTVGFLLAWLSTYLTEVKKFPIMNVGFIAAAPFAGALFGNLAGGFISDRFLGGRRKPAMMISSLFTMMTMFLLTAAPSQPVLLSLLLFVIGFFLSVGLSAFVIYPSRLCDREGFPLAMGFVNTGGQLGAAVVPLVAGLLLDHYGWNSVFIAISGGAGLAFLVLSLAIEPLGEPARA